MAWWAVDKDLEMPCYVDQMSRLVLKGDSNRLRQVLVNLLGNAVKFTEAGEVTVRSMIVGRQDDRVTVRFSISDTGIGIAPDKLDRLFQSFSQVDASTTRNYGGTGLGLAISQSLVELMGGTIGVDSEAGKGSTFWFEASFALVAESSEGVPGQLQLAGLRVLIVDDNETNRLILNEYASGWGLTSITTASVDEALAAVDRAQADGAPFHVVLTDYNMPERDGLDLARALKDHPQLIVLLLGSTDIYLNPDQLREHGIDAILRKPLRRHELYDVLCGVLVSTETVAKPTGNKPHSANEEAHLSGHILLAEDNSINQMYMVELMKQFGCTCDTVPNGREAIVAVQQTNYDLVLMDCQMPEMDGYEATRALRADPAHADLPIIAMTADAMAGDRERLGLRRIGDERAGRLAAPGQVAGRSREACVLTGKVAQRGGAHLRGRGTAGREGFDERSGLDGKRLQDRHCGQDGKKQSKGTHRSVSWNIFLAGCGWFAPGKSPRIDREIGSNPKGHIALSGRAG
jgi:Amt family ammonium transporter